MSSKIHNHIPTRSLMHKPFLQGVRGDQGYRGENGQPGERVS
jgi:hypothetical protein